MSLVTVSFLVGRLKKAELRWDVAMARKGYRDDPNDSQDLKQFGPWTDQDWVMYGWADSWRLMVHAIENELDAMPETAALRAEQSALSSYEPTYFVAEMDSASLANATRELRGAEQSSKPSVKKRK